MGNRVEDLETQVAELQAAVDGLTEELVETKERINQLESAADVRQEESSRGSHAEFVPNASATADAADANRSDAEPSQGSPEGADEADAKGDGASDDGSESEETDDIIVA